MRFYVVIVGTREVEVSSGLPFHPQRQDIVNARCLATDVVRSQVDLLLVMPDVALVALRAPAIRKREDKRVFIDAAAGGASNTLEVHTCAG